ncbi:MAG TPA: Gfo/Idh/MocA family oxidoreductase [Planctomycetota bacterium]|nr:Gfo/Idh/MocA family oxidoreductase [Planctomycetota bacterium]
MLNIGVIGCGMVSGYGHLPTIAASKPWHLAAVCDTDEKRLADATEKYHPDEAFTDYRKLVKLPGLDAAVVATHVDTHEKITLAALGHGLHVFCEKPMAASVRRCRRMVDAAAKADRLLAVNFNTRTGTVYRRIKCLIDEGAMGEVRVVRFVFDWSCHQWHPVERLEQFMVGGGPIVDSGVHFFDGIRWFTGREIEAIDARGVILEPHENPQHVIAVCRLAGGGVALVEAGWLYTRRTKDEGAIFRIDVIGDDGAVTFVSPGEILRVYTRTGTSEERIEDRGKHFEIAYENLAESVEKGRLVGLASGEDGLKATEAALRALASARR